MFYATSTDEPNSSRGGLAFNDGATIQIWRRVIEDAFGGPVSSNRQKPLLLNSILPLSSAMVSVNLLAGSTAGAMELARQLNFSSIMGVDEPSIVTHGPPCRTAYIVADKKVEFQPMDKPTLG